MSVRLAIKEIAPEPFLALSALDRYVAKSSLDDTIWDLVKISVSQMNGCAFCVDMHSFDAKEKGETLTRLFAVAAWREAPFFTDTERAALALAQAVTSMGPTGVSDGVWKEATRHFDDAQLAALIICIGTINFWNRIAVSTRMVAGETRSQ